jgi:hypothetical protein
MGRLLIKRADFSFYLEISRLKSRFTTSENVKFQVLWPKWEVTGRNGVQLGRNIRSTGLKERCLGLKAI